MNTKNNKEKRVTKQIRVSTGIHQRLRIKGFEECITVSKLADRLLDEVLSKKQKIGV